MIEVAPRPTKSRMRQVGRRLVAGDATEQDLADLESYLILAHEIQRQATDMLRAELLQRYLETERQPTTPGSGSWISILPGRAKTSKSLIDKLRRTPGCPLQNVRDVAGVRIVVNASLAHQDAVCDIAAQLLHEGAKPAKLIDRRKAPVGGYRALHVEVFRNGMPLEIQVRTRSQHSWAELFEKAADEWGRQIRYGGPPNSAYPLAGRSIALLEKISDVIYKLESMEAIALDAVAFVRSLPSKLAEVVPSGSNPATHSAISAALRSADRTADTIEGRVVAARSDLDSLLSQLGTLEQVVAAAEENVK